MSTAMVAAGLGWHAFQFGYVAHLNLAASLAWSCVVHLLASTVPVAVVISLMDSRRAFGTWSEIFHLSFPYYLASTGLASIAAAVGGHTNWPTLAGIACVMFVTYRSYRMYFNAMQNEPIEQTPQTAKAAAAGK
jgi:hypothetical protein